MEVPRILLSEERSAIIMMKRNKDTGPDEVVMEMVEALENYGVMKLTEVINKIYDDGKFPDDLCKSIFIALPKKPGAVECGQHRTTSLMSHITKIILRVLLQLMDDLERCGLHVQDSSLSSETDSEPRQREPSQHDRTKLVEQRNEVFARYEVLEEHNKRLEEQLRNFRAMIRKETSQGRTDPSFGSANPSLKHSPSFPPGNTTFHQGGSMNQVSNRSSGYQASSGYDRTGERLPPYGQSHPALDTIADHSSGSSGASAARPRFIMMGKDYPDGRGDPGRGHPPLYTNPVSSLGIGGMGQPVHVNDFGQGNRSGGLGQHRSMAGPLSNVQTGSIQNLPPAPSYHHNMDPSVLASPVYAHGPQTSASTAYQDIGDGAQNYYV
eukprot:XP_011680512.1 PREDICTED: uncharacterized protein LOC105445976 [Strongylocentrotus purpuratus]